jgi:uncharacterized membrane-anchored protein YitT (DUF2179 family)
LKIALPDVRRTLLDYAQILLGCIVGAVAYPLFLIPNDIAPGGVTGVATILHYLFKYPVGITSLLLNIPLFLAGFRTMGKRFVFRTLLATLMFSALIDIIKVEPITRDPMMASIYGGVLLGAGLAIILRGGATTGGTDMLARMLHKHASGISVGMFLFMFDFFVILAAGILMSAEHAMHAMISVFIASKVLDTVLTGIGSEKACYVISRHHEAITRRILTDMQRGVTVLNATGGFSGENISMLLCVVGRMEVTALKSIIREEDRNAFVFITETHETLGEGFHDLSADSL